MTADSRQSAIPTNVSDTRSDVRELSPMKTTYNVEVRLLTICTMMLGTRLPVRA